jgi:hypothetical protein
VVTVVVDAANVMGSRPNGWWRDRAGAAARLYSDLVRVAANDDLKVPGFPGEVEFVLVLEGAARAARAQISAAPARGVRVIAAEGSGDDAIVTAVRELSGDRVVVTADRELRHRCEALGAEVLGPRWLLRLLDQAAS